MIETHRPAWREGGEGMQGLGTTNWASPSAVPPAPVEANGDEGGFLGGDSLLILETSDPVAPATDE
jgi:hypothetical protein